MGIALGLCLDPEMPDVDLDTDGKTLFDCAPQLDEIAEAQEITPPFSTFILDPESMVDDLPEGEIISETWHDSHAGLRVVSGLIEAIEGDSKLRKGIDERGGPLTPLARTLGIPSGMEGRWAEDVLAQLKKLERCLQLASQAGARFYLLTC